MMVYDYETFKLDNQWQMVHLPLQPNGFGIFIIGDVNHFVEEDKSLWTQSLERQNFIHHLLDQGYTVFYSNLYGHHWGSPDAVALSELVYEVVMRRYTLNESIHILSEGMGALIALQLAERFPNKIRSIALFNPCLDLDNHIKNEKQKRVFFKTLEKEILEAYNEDSIFTKCYSYRQFNKDIPIGIWQSVNHSLYPLGDHARPFEKYAIESRLRVSLYVHLAERHVISTTSLIPFLKKHDAVL